MIESVRNAGPRELESQRIAKETADERKARMDKAAFMQQLKADVASTLANFHCNICDKSSGPFDATFSNPAGR